MHMFLVSGKERMADEPTDSNLAKLIVNMGICEKEFLARAHTLNILLLTKQQVRLFHAALQTTFSLEFPLE
jgi:hypothetical protein